MEIDLERVRGIARTEIGGACGADTGNAIWSATCDTSGTVVWAGTQGKVSQIINMATWGATGEACDEVCDG